jgi:hypothetical protein
VIACKLPCAAHGQEAEVTFYNKGDLLKEGMPFAVTGNCRCYIYRNEERLAYFMPARFLTLKMEPGSYVFSASYSDKHPAKNSALPLTLGAGEKYFISIEAVSRGVVVDFPRGRLTLVSCQAAHEHLPGYMGRLDDVNISDSESPKTIRSMSMPPCV